MHLQCKVWRIWRFSSMTICFLTNTIFETVNQVSTHITMPKERNKKQICEKVIGSGLYFSPGSQMYCILMLWFWTSHVSTTILYKARLTKWPVEKEKSSSFIDFEQMVKMDMLKTFKCSKGYWLNVNQILLKCLDSPDSFFREHRENKFNQNT